jgi:hypothetical protein
MKKEITLEDKLGYWLERYAWNNCSSFDIYLLLEDYFNITEDEVSVMLDMYMLEIVDDANEHKGIDEHIDNFINKLKKLL